MSIRLADRVVGEGIQRVMTAEPVDPRSPKAKHLRDLTTALLNRLRNAPRYIADDVASYYFTSQREFGPADFQCIRPPFEVCWVEAAPPAQLHFEGEDQQWSTCFPQLKRFGAVIDSTLIDGLSGDRRTFYEQQIGNPLATVLVMTTLIVDFKTGGPTIWGSYISFCQDDGTPVLFKNGRQWMYSSWNSGDAVDTDDDLGMQMLLVLDPLMLALTMLNCANLPTTEETVTEPKLVRAYQRRTGHTITPYRVLRLERRASGGDTTGTGSTKRFHLVRGHVRRMPEVGASGRRYVKRLQWVRSHARGDLDQGSVTYQETILHRREDG
jgi:hypothetical protein